MNTQTIAKFNMMDEAALAGVEGGVDWGRFGRCALSIGIGAGEAYATTFGGTIILGPYAVGTGAIGAVIGGIGGALTC